MATVARRPLAPRAFPVQLPVGVSPLRTTKATHVMATIKRPRSPDVFDAPTRTGVSTNKRPKCVTATPEQERKDREKRKAERDAQKEEFRVKYTRAFPSWTFYFDTPDSEKERLAARVEQLDAVSCLVLLCYTNLTSRKACGKVLLERGHALRHESPYTCDGYRF